MSTITSEGARSPFKALGVIATRMAGRRRRSLVIRATVPVSLDASGSVSMTSTGRGLLKSPGGEAVTITPRRKSIHVRPSRRTLWHHPYPCRFFAGSPQRLRADACIQSGTRESRGLLTVLRPSWVFPARNWAMLPLFQCTAAPPPQDHVSFPATIGCVGSPGAPASSSF